MVNCSPTPLNYIALSNCCSSQESWNDGILKIEYITEINERIGNFGNDAEAKLNIKPM